MQIRKYRSKHSSRYCPQAFFFSVGFKAACALLVQRSFHQFILSEDQQPFRRLRRPFSQQTEHSKGLFYAADLKTKTNNSDRPFEDMTLITITFVTF
jgi:hypothetical protein